MPFELSVFQEDVVDKLGLSLNKDVFLEAVCGAGKTEMVLPLLVSSINKGKVCGWAIPRREIVLELGKRLRKYFPNLEIVTVCGGHTDVVEGDLIICTTHQMYRYKDYFDILVLDEPDAFPYAKNEMLATFVEKSITTNGHIIYLSATKDKMIEDKLKKSLMDHIQLPIRPSLKLLPVPIWRLSIFSNGYFIYDLYRHRKERCLIFVPTRKMARQLSRILRYPYITSESTNKETILEDFNSSSQGCLITTTVLERGVTFNEIYCFVVCADHPVFNTSSLIQISGRTQRGLNPIKGESYFYSKTKSKSIIACINDIKTKNNHAQSALKT